MKNLLGDGLSGENLKILVSLRKDHSTRTNILAKNPAPPGGGRNKSILKKGRHSVRENQ